MKQMGLSKSLLDAVSGMLKSNQTSDVNLQEKIRRDNSNSRSADSFVAAYSAVVGEERKQHQEQQASFAVKAAKAHMRMGKSIMEGCSYIAATEQSLVSDEIIEQTLVVPASLYSTKRMYMPLDEQRQAIAEFTRSFILSFEKMVDEHVDTQIREQQSFAESLNAVKNNIRNMLLNSNNIGTAIAKVNEVSKIKQFVGSLVKVDEAKKLIGTYTHTNGHTAKVYKLSGEHNEGDPYHVKLFKGGKHHEPADYFTNDEDDAHGTAKHMVKEDVDVVELSEGVVLTESLAVHGKYTIKSGAAVSGMKEGSPDHVKAHSTKLKAIGVKADAAAKDGRYGTTHRVVVKNNETGETTHHHVYQSDKAGNKPIMSVRNVGVPRANQDEHHQVLKDYLTGKKPTTQPVKEEVTLSAEEIARIEELARKFEGL